MQWTRLAPLLDELLDLPPADRDARLAALRAEDAALAGRLADWLARDAALDDAGFLARPAGGVLAAPLHAGQTAGAYTLERLLGEGGMGSVWLARRSDGRFDAQVAIKFLRPGLLTPGETARFAREGAILARLAHPHIARLHDAGVTPDGQLPYLVLEYVAGEPIDRWCEARGLDTRARVRLLLDVLDAVAHAHNQLVLHRDLKPSNILVTDAGRAMLLDFGVAKLLDAGDGGELTRHAGSAFTPGYAAPEQLQGDAVGTATDVYALGVLLYGLLGGGHPTTPEPLPTLQRLRSVLEVVPRRLSEAVRARDGGRAARGSAQARRLRELRGDLDTIVARALKKAPEERYANAAAMAADLRRWLAHQPIAARDDQRWYVAGKFLRRHRAAVAGGAAATLAVAVAVAGALAQGREAARQRDHAEALIEFMLGDLRRKLQPVGRLDVLDAVGERVLTHYAAQPPDGLDAEALGRRARALQLLGELAETRGQLDAAAHRIGEAAQATGLLLARAPRDGQRLFDHAQSEYWLGYIARRRGQAAQVDLHFGRYLALAEQLVALDPRQPDWQLERAYALYNLGLVRLEAGQAAPALALFEPARAALAADAAQRPASLNDLANVLGGLAMAHTALGAPAAARTALQAKIDALARVPDAAQDMRAQRQLAATWRELGMLALAEGPAGLATAADALGQALRRCQRLLALEPDNLDWQALALLVHLGLVEQAHSAGDADGARARLAQATPLLQRLLRADASKLYWQVDLQGHHLLQAWALGQAGPEALQTLQAQLRQRVAAGATLDRAQQRLLAELTLRLGDALAAAGQRAPARAQWQAAADALAAGGGGPDFRAICLRAMALAALGDLQPARQLADSVGASAFRHPVYAELRRRLADPS